MSETQEQDFFPIARTPAEALRKLDETLSRDPGQGRVKVSGEGSKGLILLSRDVAKLLREVLVHPTDGR